MNKRILLVATLLLLAVLLATQAVAPAKASRPLAPGTPPVDYDNPPVGMNDVITADDAIITGSLCTGFDCVADEAFGFDTYRLKENNLRINFEDTSSTAGFPANDWRLVANDASSGGANYFAIEDVTAARVPFKLMAGAGANSLYIDPTGNVGLGTASPTARLHVNGNILANGYVQELSDRNAKTNFAAVDGEQVLARLAELPLTTWSYKNENGVRHMGPIAQDFYAAFGLGQDDTHLAALDVNGVSLAAIQTLNQQVNAKTAQIETLENQVDRLEARMNALEGAASPSAAWLTGLVGALVGLFAGMALARRVR
ncbi:MAG: tail fiber domain-containing protein [Anaerolineae bacterium]|nr:tail fiber domain-containing protein [Anaerolineae bacterium]